MRIVIHYRLPAMRPALLLLPLFALPFAACADDDMARVEIKSASALQQRRNDSTGGIVVTRDELLRYGDSSVADALRRQPGISINGGEVQLRGLGGGRTQFLLNGEPAPPGFSPDPLSPELIERIEIMHSASADSSTQGIAGSINIVLRKSTSRAQTQAKLAFAHGSAGWSPEAILDLSRPGEDFSGTLAAQAARTPRSGDSTISERSVHSERVTAETDEGVNERIGLTPRLNWKFADGGTLAWQSLLDIVRSDNRGKAHETTLWGDASAYPRNAYVASAHTVTARSDASGTRQFSDSAKLEWKAGLAHNRRNSNYRFTGSDGADVPLWLRHVLSNAVDDSASSSGKLRFGGGSGHALAIGWDGTQASRSEWRRQEDASAAGVALDELDQRYQARVRRLALFAQDEWSPMAAMDFYLGLRWEGLRTRTDGRDLAAVASHSGVWSPIGHLLWRVPGQSGQVRLALSRSYKAPAARDLVPRRYTVNNDNGPTNPHSQGNPALRPELAWGMDAAYEKYFGRDSMVSVSTYLRRIGDVIQSILFQDKGEWVSSPRNLGHATASGIALDGRATLGDSGATARFALSRNWSHVAAIPGPGNRLGEQTPAVLNAGLDYRLNAALTAGFSWNVQTGGNVRISGTQWSERATERRLDLHASWLPRPGLALRVSATNLLAPDSRSEQRYESGADNVWRGTVSRIDRTIRLAAEFAL
jgi:outer membrane receptor for ferrienterochelin and colicin